jgi:uncharacterized membrane-anchored protein YhcB (DUF1043 family)
MDKLNQMKISTQQTTGQAVNKAGEQTEATKAAAADTYNKAADTTGQTAQGAKDTTVDTATSAQDIAAEKTNQASGALDLC